MRHPAPLTRPAGALSPSDGERSLPSLREAGPGYLCSRRGRRSGGRSVAGRRVIHNPPVRARTGSHRSLMNNLGNGIRAGARGQCRVSHGLRSKRAPGALRPQRLGSSSRVPIDVVSVCPPAAEPSRGAVLSAIGPEADGGTGVLREVLLGRDSGVRVPAAAKASAALRCAAAVLFTTARSGFAPDPSARL